MLNRELEAGSDLDFGVTAASGGRTSHVYLQLGRDYSYSPIQTAIDRTDVCY